MQNSQLIQASVAQQRAFDSVRSQTVQQNQPTADQYARQPSQIGPANIVQPNEPTLLGYATELLNWIATLEGHCDGLNGALFGGGECGSIHPTSTTLSGMLAEAAERAASLCGNLATIKLKLGCCPESVYSRSDPQPR